MYVAKQFLLHLIFVCVLLRGLTVGQGLLVVEFSRSYSDKPHSVGLALNY